MDKVGEILCRAGYFLALTSEVNKSSMRYEDSIYGRADIEEPVLQGLIASTAVQRLKGVLQHGISGVIGLTAPITRFEHSMGALLLVKRLNGAVSEQIAALLHDVSHTAFSHVIDYVYDGHNSQDYHEEVKERYINSTDLPDLLQQHGYNWRDFLDETQYPLLEQPAPRLCADRLDYFLRDSIALELATQADVDNVLQHLTVHENRIVTNDIEAARWLAYTYIDADMASWANFREVGLYELTARAIRRALATTHIHTDDFWKTDQELWDSLQNSDDEEVRNNLALVSIRTQFVWDATHPTFWVGTKLRSVDPDVLLRNGNVAPLSRLDPQFAEYRLRYHRQRQGPWPMRVIAAAY